MQFNIITIFPDIFNCYFGESIIKRAQEKGLVKIGITNLRHYTSDRHQTVDDSPYGGGPGMVLKIEPIFDCVSDLLGLSGIKKYPRKLNGDKKTRVILLSAKGKKFNQAMARKLAKYGRLILICGHYEGVDERVAKHVADEEISIGDYILTGGELPAMILVDGVSRLIPGVLGKKESLAEESFSTEGLLEYPQYTRPEDFRGWAVPKVLLSGDHKKIKEWRAKNSKY